MRVIFDMMAITLEKLSITTDKPSVTPVVARATIRSLLILAHIISLASSDTHSQVSLSFFPLVKCLCISSVFAFVSMVFN